MQNVYLVEDSPEVLQRLAKLLTPVPGAQIVGHARSASDAISGILATRPHIVVLDLSLAKSNGFDVLSAVHRAAPDIDFIVLSNFTSEPYRRQALRLGAIDFFDKTNEFERVRDAVAARAATKH
jgi:DNA-binding NarL/FixJ family response regulator